MDGTSASPQRHNAAQRSAHIRQVVLAKGVELRERYPILKHQDALGAGILAFALIGMIGSATLYITGHMAWWACLLLNAFFASLTHELEHDLIRARSIRGFAAICTSITIRSPALKPTWKSARSPTASRGVLHGC
jgi:fatty acid desaturase